MNTMETMFKAIISSIFADYMPESDRSKIIEYHHFDDNITIGYIKVK